MDCRGADRHVPGDTQVKGDIVRRIRSALVGIACGAYAAFPCPHACRHAAGPARSRREVSLMLRFGFIWAAVSLMLALLPVPGLCNDGSVVSWGAQVVG